MSPHATNASTLLDALTTALLAIAAPPTRKLKRRPGPASAAAAAADAEQISPSELGDSLAFAASAIWDCLPAPLRDSTPEDLQARRDVARYTPPLAPAVLEALLAPIPPEAREVLGACVAAVAPDVHVDRLIEDAVVAYLEALTTTAVAVGDAQAATPPVTRKRTEACELCERSWIPLTAHHLIPRSTHAKVIKRGWHPPERVSNVAWICRACHNFVHAMASNEELAREWYDLDRILEREDVQKWVGWVARVRWKKT